MGGVVPIGDVSALRRIEFVSEEATQEGPDGYLRRYDDDLAGALELVIADLVAGGFGLADAEVCARKVASRLDDGFERTGGQVALWVAEAIQDDVIAEISGPWPRCPDHPSHPLWLTPEGSPTCAWTCPTTGEHVAELGDLLRALPQGRPEPHLAWVEVFFGGKVIDITGDGGPGNGVGANIR
jgi:hypothetical protein